MQVSVYGGTSSNIIVQKAKDNRRNVRWEKITTRKHCAVLGPKHRDHDDALR